MAGRRIGTFTRQTMAVLAKPYLECEHTGHPGDFACPISELGLHLRYCGKCGVLMLLRDGEDKQPHVWSPRIPGVLKMLRDVREQHLRIVRAGVRRHRARKGA